MLVGPFNKEKAQVSDFTVERRVGSLTALSWIQRQAESDEERKRGNFLFSLNFAIENIKDVQQKSRVSRISLLYWRIQDVVKWQWQRRTIIINGHNLRRFIRVPVSNIQPSGVTGTGGPWWTFRWTFHWTFHRTPCKTNIRRQLLSLVS